MKPSTPPNSAAGNRHTETSPTARANPASAPEIHGSNGAHAVSIPDPPPQEDGIDLKSPPANEQPPAELPANKSLSREARYLVPAAAVLLVIGLVWGFAPRTSKSKVAAADTQQLAIPIVSVTSPTVGPPPVGLMLPAEVRPWQEASIYSRVNGYLKTWRVDIGAHVKQDDLLAEIDTPDLDHQLEQARSQATLAKSSFELAKITNEKWQRLFRQGVVSELDADNTATNQNTADANAKAFAENLQVLEEEVGFKRITAPFPGVITNRHTNVGDLIVANNVNNEMFHIQQIDPLRIYFWIPQGNANDIRAGQSIDVVFPAPVNKTLQAKVATTSESIAPNSRTLLVELHMANRDSQIPAGSFAEVRLPASMLGTTLTIPDSTLLFRAEGLQVGILKPDSTVELHDIKVGRDFGTKIEVTSGVSPSDKLIDNPPDSLVSGETVRLALTAAAASKRSSGSDARVISQLSDSFSGHLRPTE